VVSLVVTNWTSCAWVSSAIIAIDGWSVWEWAGLTSSLSVSDIVMEVIEESVVDGEVTTIGVIGYTIWISWVYINFAEPVDLKCMEDFTWVLLIYNGSFESISNLLYFHILFINDIVSKLIESPFHIIISIIAVPHGVVSGLKDIILFLS